MGKIFEAGELPEHEKVYLKKDIFGWRVVEPPTKWYHYLFGSKRNVFVLSFILIIALLFYLGIGEINKGCQDMANDPCSYCLINNKLIDAANTTYVGLYYDLDDPNTTYYKFESDFGGNPIKY
jgi:hypothetical protein